MPTRGKRKSESAKEKDKTTQQQAKKAKTAASTQEEKNNAEDNQPSVKTPTKKKAVRKTKAERLAELTRKFRTIDWRDLDFIGMELGGIDEIYEDDFEFPTLNYELQDGALANAVSPLHLYLGAQPIQMGETVKNIPYIVIIECKRPPSGKVSLVSIYLNSETILPVKKFHMNWVPYYPKEYQSVVEGVPVQIYTLAFEGRRSAIDKLSQEEKHHISLLMPYELLPKTFETDLEKKLKEVISVNFEFTTEAGKKIGVVWDKECMRTSIDIDTILEDEKLPETEGPRIKEALKVEFEKARERVRKRHEEETKILESLPPSELQALKEMKVYKFYPTHPTIPVETYIDPMVNRYYGKADQVFPAKKTESTSTKDTKEPQPVTEFVLPPTSSQPLPAATTGFVFGGSQNGKETASQGFVFSGSSNTSSSTGFVLPSSTQAAAPTTGFVFGGFSAPSNSTSGKDSSSWVCACCSTKNPESAKECSSCMVPKPK